VLAPHRGGLPGVNLHCAMHSYRIGNPNEPTKLGTPHSLWFEYLGVQSSGHGPQQPIAIAFTNKTHAVARGLSDWTTINEELYNNIKVLDTAQPLAWGTQSFAGREGKQRTNSFVVAWANSYGDKKTRVFSTTIGHNSATVEDGRYLELVARGVLWATGHLKEDGTAAEGYGKGTR
jgi:type 1 glutamine amidotransferase